MWPPKDLEDPKTMSHLGHSTPLAFPSGWCVHIPKEPLLLIPAVAIAEGLWQVEMCGTMPLGDALRVLSLLTGLSAVLIRRFCWCSDSIAAADEGLLGILLS